MFALIFSWIERSNLTLKPVLSRSPACNSDNATDLPFSPSTVATDGKQPLPFSGINMIVICPKCERNIIYSCNCCFIIHNFGIALLKNPSMVLIVLIQNSYHYKAQSMLLDEEEI